MQALLMSVSRLITNQRFLNFYTNAVMNIHSIVTQWSVQSSFVKILKIACWRKFLSQVQTTCWNSYLYSVLKCGSASKRRCFFLKFCILHNIYVKIEKLLPLSLLITSQHGRGDLSKYQPAPLTPGWGRQGDGTVGAVTVTMDTTWQRRIVQHCQCDLFELLRHLGIAMEDRIPVWIVPGWRCEHRQFGYPSSGVPVSCWMTSSNIDHLSRSTQLQSSTP